MPSDRALNQAAVKLLQRFRWTRVGVVTQGGGRLSEVQRSFKGAGLGLFSGFTDSLLLQMKKDLMRQLVKEDVRVESFSDDACSSLRKLKVPKVRLKVDVKKLM